ncbi:MAG: diacylglycerol/lipid kinase family protein [Planctomycetota bacterium]|jgi:diacylglycerol kinase family enzyme
MQIEILANPFSGRGRGPERAARIAELLSARGHSVGVHIGRSRQDGIQWARNACDMAERLVVVGGDGTFNSVINGLTADAPPVALSPLGTANLMACELSLSRRPEDTVTLVERGERQMVDLPKVSSMEGLAKRSRRCFLCLGFGFDGEVMRLMDVQRDGPIHKAQYLKLLGDALRSWTPVPQEITANDQPVGEYSYGIISGISIYGSRLLRLGPCELGDGTWELFLFRDLNLLRGGLFAMAAAGGQLDKLPDVRRIRVQKVGIAGNDPTPLQVDGDYVGNTPLEFQLDGMQVPLLVARP